MGIQTETQATATNAKETKKVEGWLNLVVKAKDGTFHSVKCYIPLESNNDVHRAMLNKEDGTEFEIIGTVKHNVTKEIEL